MNKLDEMHVMTIVHNGITHEIRKDRYVLPNGARIDQNDFTITQPGKPPEKLSTANLVLLNYFYINRGVVLTHEMIVSSMRGDGFATGADDLGAVSRNLVLKLRKAIGAVGDEVIECRRGAGYVLKLTDAAPAPKPVPPAPKTAEPSQRMQEAMQSLCQARTAAAVQEAGLDLMDELDSLIRLTAPEIPWHEPLCNERMQLIAALQQCRSEAACSEPMLLADCKRDYVSMILTCHLDMLFIQAMLQTECLKHGISPYSVPKQTAIQFDRYRRREAAELLRLEEALAACMPRAAAQC